MADAAFNADLADRREDQILGGYAEAQFAFVADPHRLGTTLPQSLRGEDVFNFAGADAERERPKGAMGRRVAVAADNRHPRLSDAELRPDHVNNPLMLGAKRIDGHPKLGAVGLKRFDLNAA
uniref:Unannotated protein n=1 Tax=freshwater metagenome TaxID=449393 RepID=A0A6J6A0F8_9ZZZZ